MAVTGDPRQMGTLGSLTPPVMPSTTQVPLTPTMGEKFIRPAPAATPYGDFAAPDPSQLANDPYYQFRVNEGQRGLEHSAAARGTLLSGGTLRGLERYRQGVASEEAGNAFNRALQVYGTNRDTNAQNFGQAHTSFGDDLSAFGANVNAANVYGHLGAGPAAGGGMDSGGGATSIGSLAPSSLESVAPIGEDYAAQLAAQRAQNAAESARIRGPVARTPTPWLTPERRGTGA